MGVSNRNPGHSSRGLSKPNALSQLAGAIDFTACYIGQRMDPSHSLRPLGLVKCLG